MHVCVLVCLSPRVSSLGLWSIISIFWSHSLVLGISVSYCMVCASVWEDNPRALARGLSPVQIQNHTIYCLLNKHVLARCALRDI